jgi:hypothetical protein
VAEKQPKKPGRGGPRPGSGRPKGSLDKGNALIREMIVEALHGVGGVAYLQEKAESHPQAFLSLIGKVMPVQVEGGDNPIQHAIKVTFE